MPISFLKITNYKSIREFHFEFSPITFLIGPNNSGKSSVIKAIQLLKDNLCDPEFKTRSFNELLFDSKPITGSFESCLNTDLDGKKKMDKSISFVIPCKLFADQVNMEIEYRSVGKGKPGILRQLLIYQLENEKERPIMLSQWINAAETESQNNYSLTTHIDYNYFRQKLIESRVNLQDSVSDFTTNDSIANDVGFRIFSAAKREFANIENDNKTRELARFNPSEPFFSFKFSLNYKYSGDQIRLETEFLDALYQSGTETHESWDKLMRILNNIIVTPRLRMDISKGDFMKANSIVDIGLTNNGRIFFQDLASELNKCLDNSINGFRRTLYLSADKSSQKRIYVADEMRNAFTEILYRYVQNRLNKKHQFVNKWLKKLNIISEEECFEITELTETYPKVFRPIIINKKSGVKRDLIDYGFGTTQLVMLLLLVSNHSNRGHAVILEEPEMNLHPNFQSQLADIIVDAHKKFGIQLLIETHSEYLIRKLQYLIARKLLSNDTAKVYYFNPNGNDKIQCISFGKRGNLSSLFDSGFYDEAITWKFELLKILKEQEN